MKIVTILDEIAEYQRKKTAPATPTAMINSIIDISHFKSCDLPTLKAAGMVTTIIHKASQGASFQDPMYAARKQEALDLGFQWGSFHFGTGVDVMDQVENYLSSLGTTGPGEFISFDFEPNPGGMSATWDQVHEFVTLIHNELGFYPTLYGGYWIRLFAGTDPDPLLANCPLWYARYASAPRGIPYQVWPSWTLWQYTDAGTVDGIDGACDRNWYNGTADDLAKNWPFRSQGA